MEPELYEQMWQIFRKLGVAALGMNHYTLAESTDIQEPQLWKVFLMEPEVAEYIRVENNLIRDSELNKMMLDISKSNSVGKAQLMNTLAKLSDDRSGKEGPVFIYTYVPLSPEQIQAENVNILTSDPFLRREQ